MYIYIVTYILIMKWYYCVLPTAYLSCYGRQRQLPLHQHHHYSSLVRAATTDTAKWNCISITVTRHW